MWNTFLSKSINYMPYYEMFQRWMNGWYTSFSHYQVTTNGRQAQWWGEEWPKQLSNTSPSVPGGWIGSQYKVIISPVHYNWANSKKWISVCFASPWSHKQVAEQIEITDGSMTNINPQKDWITEDGSTCGIDSYMSWCNLSQVPAIESENFLRPM